MQSKPGGEVPSERQTIYYVGRAENWRAAPHFERVRYSSIYRGIDLVFLAPGDRLEYNFEIAPYADPRLIRIHSEGSSFDLTPEGDLAIHAHNTVITERRPFAFQMVQGQKQSVACEYRWQEGHDIGLGLGAYDPAAPLFIDPVLDFGSYFGGSSFDAVNAAATDANGNLYVAGETSSGSLTNPSTAPRASRDVFIAKFSPAGALLFAVYLGGSAYDSGRGIALDTLGNIYVTGVTNSSDFPTTSGAFSTHAPGGGDAFVAKFSAGFVLQYATFLGGGGSDTGSAIAVDSSGGAYISGQTNSTAFPVTSGAFQTSNHGGLSDCFISKLNPAGSALAYSMFLGGSALDLCEGIAVDASGNAYVTGTTYSIDFPVTGALQSSLLGTASAFVAKVNPAGSALTYSTYLGGSSIDNAKAVAVDSSGEAYVTGDTASFDFPITPGVFQNQLAGLYNAFVSKFSAAGNSLVYSTLIGGSGSDVGTSIAVDSSGRAILGGYTTSFNFPTAQAIQPAFQGSFDAFSAVLDPGGASLIFSSYFGGAGDDRGYAVAVAPAGVLYLAGMTSSSNLPVEFPIQAGLNVAPDAFVLGITYIVSAPAAISVTPSSGSGASQAFALQYTDPGGAANLNQLWVYFNPTLNSPANQACMLYYNRGAGQVYLLNEAGTVWQPGTPGSAATLQNSQCSLSLAATTLVLNGNTLTFNLPMTFPPAYAGLKNIYTYATDASGANTGGFQQLGTWTVPVSTGPTAISVTPSSGSGANQTFAMQYTDSGGAASLNQLWVYFNPTLNSPANQACMLYYNQGAGQVYLLNEAGTVWQPGIPGSATTLQNSQCSLSLAATTLVLNGNTLTFNLPMTFLPAYGGVKNVYTYATDASGANTGGFQQLGTWTVPSGAAPVANSLTPSSGSGASQTFALQYTDSGGAASLNQLWVYFNPALNSPASQACMLYYNQGAGQVYLLNEAGTVWQPGTPGSAATLQNSQCSLSLAATSLVLNGNTLTFNLPMTFLHAYAGLKNIYTYATDALGANTGAFQQLGTWTVP